jgi:hypothetical protein
MSTKRSWKNFLLLRGMQLRYTGLLLTVTVVLYLMLGGLYVHQVTTSDEMLLNLEGVQVLLADSAGDEADEDSEDDGLDSAEEASEEAEYLAEVSSFIEREQSGLVGLLFLALFALVALLFFGGITLTHRVAGPIYVVDRYLKEMAKGNLCPPRAFRKGDEFTFLHDDLVALCEALSTRERDDITRLKEIAAALETPEGLDTGRAKLSTLIEEKRDRIRE